jgi:hypothetical protein
MMENNSLPSYSGKHVIFCEGKTDIPFFGAFLEEKGISRTTLTLDDLYWEDCKGKDEIPAKLKKAFTEALEDLEAYSNPPKSFIVVLDGDLDPKTGVKLANKKFTTYQKLFEQQGVIIDAQNTISQKPNEWGLYGGIFIIDDKEFHDLESLCLKIATKFQEDDRYQKIVATFQNQRLQLKEPPKYPNKADVAVYLASMPEPCSTLGLALKKKYFNIQATELEFLDELVKHLSKKPESH